MTQVDAAGWPEFDKSIGSLRVVQGSEAPKRPLTDVDELDALDDAANEEVAAPEPQAKLDSPPEVKALEKPTSLHGIDALIARVGELEERAETDRNDVVEASKTARWLNVRVMVLEQALRVSETQAEELALQLSLCVEDLRDQDERVAARLSQIERDMLEHRADRSHTAQEIIELREARGDASARLEQLALSLVVATEQAEALALTSQRAAVSRLSEIEGELQGLATRGEEVAALAKVARSRADVSVEASELVVEGLGEVADSLIITRQSEAVLSTRLTDTEAEFAEFADELREIVEEGGEVRVIAEKAYDKASYAADSADAVQAELDAETEKIKDRLKLKASKAAVESAVNSVHVELEAEAEEIRKSLDRKASKAAIESVRGEIDVEAAALRDELADMAPKSEVDSAVGSIQAELEAEAEALRSVLADMAPMAEVDSAVGSLQAELEAEAEEIRKSLDRKASKAAIESVRGEIDVEAAALRDELADMAPKSEVDAVVESVRMELAGMAPKSAVDSAVESVRGELAGLAPKSTVDSAVEALRDELAGMAPKSSVDAAVESVRSELADMAPKSVVDSVVESVRSELAGLASTSATDAAVESLRADLAGMAPKSAIDSAVRSLREEMTGPAKASTAAVASLRSELEGMASKSAIDAAVASLREEMADLAPKSDVDSVRQEIGSEASSLREELAKRASQSSLDEFDSVLARLREEVASRSGATATAAVTEPTEETHRPRKRWEAHLAGQPQAVVEAPKALPAGKPAKKKRSKK